MPKSLLILSLYLPSAAMEIFSQMCSLLRIFSILYNLLPPPIVAAFRSLQDFLTPYAALRIPEFNGCCAVDVNHLYRQVALYLNSVNSAPAGVNFTLARSGSSNRISCSVEPNHTVHDCFNGFRVSWTHQVETPPDSIEENRSFVLKLPKRRRQALLKPYIEHVTARAEELERVSRERRLFTNNNGFGSWSGVPFRHPSTFETLALEPEVKSQIVDDLSAFSEGKDFYRKIGRAWKRGYLLYGPPGSGKSCLIAAMANYLRYDVYDLDLSKVADNAELTSLLRQTTNRSIVVIEDIDRTVDMTGDTSYPPENSEENSTPIPTLSKLLNFTTGGLWSCCGEGRIMVFTTNEYDTAASLVRCGRMDVHVSLGTCGAHGLRTLVRNYLGVETHALLEAAAEMCGALTPAEIGEILLRNRRDADVAVKAVVSAMQDKILLGECKCYGSSNKNRESEVKFFTME